MASQYTSFSYPVFEPGQALKSKDLNGLVDYLETHDRLTRAYLIGSGIFYGLKWSVDAARGVCIQKGAGVSSEGLLFALQLEKDQNNNELPCCLNHCKEVTMAYRSFNPYLRDDQLGSGTATGAQFNFQAIELFANPENGSDVLSSKNQSALEDYCLVLFWDSKEKDRKACIDSCDGVGSDKELQMRFFLMKQSDLKKIWLNHGNNGSNGGSNDPKQFPFLTRLHKFRALETMLQPAQLYQAWKQVLTEANGSTLPLVNLPVWVANALPAGSGISAAMLQSRWQTLIDATAANEPQLQYVNDYFCDLVDTVSEILSLKTRSLQTLCPDETLFPRFIALGKWPGGGDCRMPFYRIPMEGSEDSSTEKLIFLQEKLLEMVNANQPLSPKTPVEVRITGSAFKSLPLSEQAIPFYYNNTVVLRQKWSYEHNRTGRNDLIQHYETNGAYPRNQLCYDLKKETFFRIEGHLNQPLSVGVPAIEALRKALNLPFKLVLLRLGPKPAIQYSGSNQQVLDILNYMQFSEFAKDHPGMEHMAGVPTGGTFIVVFREDFDQEILNILESPNTIPETVEVLLRQSKRTIIADFCLPYGCYSGPNVQYIFEEEIIGNETCRAEADFEERQINDLEYVFENRSPLSDSFTWEIFRAQSGAALGSAIYTETVLKTDPNPLKNLTYNFPYYGEFLVQLTARCVDNQLEDVAQKILILCPEEDLSLVVTDDAGDELQAITLDVGEDTIFTFTATPAGGTWDYKALKMAGMDDAIQETEDTLVLQFGNVDAQGQAQTYLVQYIFPCDGKTLEFLVTIIPNNQQNRVANTPEKLAKQRQNVYVQEALKMGNQKFRLSSAAKKAIDYLYLPADETSDVYARFSEVVLKLGSNIDQPGSLKSADFRSLLGLVLHLYLDRLMLDTDATSKKSALDQLETLADRLKDLKVGLANWNETDLKTADNESTLKAIQNML